MISVLLSFIYYNYLFILLIFFTNYIIFIYDLLCLAMCLYNIAFLFSFIVAIIFSRLF